MAEANFPEVHASKEIAHIHKAWNISYNTSSVQNKMTFMNSEMIIYSLKHFIACEFWLKDDPRVFEKIFRLR